MKFITRTIWILSIVSLFTDMASEMLYPVLPIYLKVIGFSVVLIGILEGLAEATIGLSKGYFGRRSDMTGRRVPFVQLGYALSTLAKPAMIFFTAPVWVFFTRTIDRLGKGIRTGARDAILSDESTPETKGRVFGFHRTFDTLGAVLGPTIALSYLFYHPGDYKTLFLICFIPGVLSVLTSFLLKDKKSKPLESQVNSNSIFSFLHYWKESPVMYRKVIIGLLAFALFNSSDIFLLLKLKESGLNDTWVIGAFIFYNLVYALAALPLGILADKIGLKITFIIGLSMFALVYTGMSFSSGLYMYLLLFAVYGIYSASTEGIAKAWLSNLSDPKDTATAIGLYSGFQSICALLASSMTGIVWYTFGPSVAFLSTAVVTFGVITYFLLLRERSENVRA